MVLPITIASSRFLAPQGGPFKSGSSFYLTAFAGTQNRPDTLDVYKADSDDPSSGWTAQDTSNAPSNTAIIGSYHVVLDGTTLHIVTQEVTASGADLLYHTFDCSTNTWSITDESVTTAPDGVSFCSISVRSDGDVVVAYQGAQESNMGTGYDRIDCARREGGTWTADISVDNLGKTTTHMRYPFVVMSANDRAHIFYNNHTDTDGVYSTYLSGNTWGHQHSAFDTVKPSDLASSFRAIRFDDAGTEKIRAISRDADNQVTVYGFDDADSPGTSITISTTAGDNTYTGGSHAFAADGATQHLLYNTSTIIYHDETGDGNDTWGTDETELSSLTSAMLFSADVYDNSGNVLAYLYLDGGNYRYNERSLGAGAFNLAADAATVTIAGQTTDLEQGFLVSADAGSMTIAAQAVALSKGKKLTATAASVDINAQSATLTKGICIIADVATVTFAAQDVALSKGHPLSAAAGSIDINAQTVEFLLGYNVVSDVATINISGQAATLLKTWIATADFGTLTIAGQEVGLQKGKTLTADTGSMDINAQGANLLRGHSVEAEAGTLDVDAQVANLLHGRLIAAESGSIDINAQAVTLLYGHTIEAAVATLTISAQATDLLHGRLIDAAVGTLDINGQAVTLNYSGSNPVIDAASGSIDINAQAAELLVGYAVTADAASVSINGQAVALSKGHPLTADVASIDINAQAAGVVHGRSIDAQPGTLVIAGATSDLLIGYLITAAAGGLDINAQNADLIYAAANVLSAEAGTIDINGQAVDLDYSGAVVSRGGILLPGAERPMEWLRRRVAEQLGDKLDEVVKDVRAARTKSRRKRKIIAAQHKMDAVEEIVAQEYVPPDVRGHLDAIRSALNAAVGAADEYSMLRQAVVNNAKMVQDRADEDRRRRRRRDEEAVAALLMSI